MTHMRSVNSHHCALVASTFLLAALFAYYFSDIRMTVVTEYGPASIGNLVAGTAPAPFQYRILLPWIVGTLHDRHTLPIHTLKGYCFGIEIVCTFALFVINWFYLGLFFKEAKVKAFGMLLLMYALSITYLVPSWLMFYYIYDIPSVCMFSLGLYLLHQRKLFLFYALFIVATANRETSIFLIPTLLLTNWQRARTSSLTHCCVLTLLWIAIKMAIGSCYNLHSLFTWKLLCNLNTLLHPYYLFQTISSLGLLWLVVLFGWRDVKVPFLRQVCMVAPLFFVGMMCVANVQEIRVYGELTPVFLPSAVVVMASALASIRGTSEQTTGGDGKTAPQSWRSPWQQ